MKHTEAYKASLWNYISAIIFIVVTGIVLTFTIRHITQDPVDFWTFYDGILSVWLICQVTILYRLFYTDFSKIAHKEHNLQWRSQRLRVEAIRAKGVLLDEDFEFLSQAPTDVLWP